MDAIFFVVVIVAVISIRIVLHFADKANILTTARAKGWTQVSVHWAPFAPGFFFEQGERHYYVSYVDKDDKRTGKYCKTSLMTGVFWRDETS